MPGSSTLSGLIIQTQSGFFTVDTPQGVVVCRLRGRLKQGRARGDLAALGDHVHLEILSDGSGIIHRVEERKRAIVRLAPRARGEYRQVLLANADQAVFVFACAQPEPRMRMLDRFLVIAEKQEVAPLIVANKVDLVSLSRARQLFAAYEPAGYAVLYTSVHSRAGLDDLAARLAGKISVFAGPSGVGKSSLLRALRPGLNLDVQDIGAANKGKHTTVVRRLIPLGDGSTYVADTPGWKSLALWDTQPEELDAYFPEIRPLIRDCRFSDCSHVEEPGCAVRAAVEAGRLSAARYDSYVRLRAGMA